MSAELLLDYGWSPRSMTKLAGRTKAITGLWLTPDSILLLKAWALG
jgi:hypothetical protein